MVFFFVLTSLNSHVWAESGEEVTIHVDSRLKQHSSHFPADITVTFSDKQLLNEKVFLSYHIYDANDKEILWEGSRIPLVMNDLGTAVLTVDLDLNLVLPAESLHYIKLVFDIVDEKNAYWFSQNKNIHFVTDQIVVDQSLSNKFVGTINSVVMDTPIIFAVNFVFFMVSIYFLLRIKRGGIFYN